MIRSIVATLLLSVCAVIANPFGEQWQLPMHVAQAVMDEQEHLHLVGTMSTSTTTGCQLAQIDLAGGSSSSDRHFLWLAPQPPTPLGDTCHGLAVNHHHNNHNDNDNDDDGQGHVNNVWMTGQSTADENDWGWNNEATSQDYGFVLNLEWDNELLQEDTAQQNNSRRFLRSTKTTATRVLNQESNNETSSAQQGGIVSSETLQAHVLGGILTDDKGFATLQVATNKEHVYTLSMDVTTDVVPDKSTSSTLGSRVPDVPFEDLHNPTLHSLVDKYATGLVIQSFTKVPYNATIDERQARGTLKWRQEIRPENNVAIAHGAGLVLLGDVMLVAGSTTGSGKGLGVSDGGTDMDGFITKLWRNDGTLYGQTNETAGQALSSVRIETQSNATDYIYGICNGESTASGRHVYVVGATTGHFAVVANATNQAHAIQAFLLRINVDTLQIVGAAQLGTVDNQGAAIGLACATTADGKYVYMAGNVEDGAVMETTNGQHNTHSGGKTDVFIARINTGEGNVEWIQQLGGADHEVLAPRGGLVVTTAGKAVLVGNTQGSLYRSKKEQDGDSNNVEVFVAMIAADGRIPEQVATPPSPDKETMAPTEGPSQVEQSTKAPTIATGKPTMAPTLPTQKVDFRHLTMRLVGAPKLTDDSKQAFEETMKLFYEMVYRDRLRRRLQEVSNFKTTVKVQKEIFDDTGNTIKYHQTVEFIAPTDNITDEQARDIIVNPFTNVQQTLNFLALLGQSDNDFLTVTNIEEPQFPDENKDAGSSSASSSNGEGGFDIMWFVYIGAGIALCCICAGYHAMRKKSAPLLADTDESYDPDRDMYDRPEQPLDYGEKNNPKAFDDNYNLEAIPPNSNSSAGGKYGMSLIGDEMFHDELSERSGSHTHGFGSDFDQPEKRSQTIRNSNADNEEDFRVHGVGVGNTNGVDEDMLDDRGKNSFESSSGSDDEDSSGSDDDEDYSGSGSSDEDDGDTDEGDEESSREEDRFA